MNYEMFQFLDALIGIYSAIQSLWVSHLIYSYMAICQYIVPFHDLIMTFIKKKPNAISYVVLRSFVVQ